MSRDAATWLPYLLRFLLTARGLLRTTTITQLETKWPRAVTPSCHRMATMQTVLILARYAHNEQRRHSSSQHSRERTQTKCLSCSPPFYVGSPLPERNMTYIWPSSTDPISFNHWTSTGIFNRGLFIRGFWSIIQHVLDWRATSGIFIYLRKHIVRSLQ